MNTTFKTIAGYAGMAFIVAGIAVARTGAQNGNPFQDKNESGEIVHVLPAPALGHNPHASNQPTDAPRSNETAVYPASYGSGNLTDHGGPEIPLAEFRAIYWNGGAANSTAT